MKKLVLLIATLLMVANCSKVPAGYVGIKVYLLGLKKGVSQEELGVGRYWIGINEELYLFPTFTQNYVWTRDVHESSPNDESLTFQTSEGLSVGADIGISYSLNPDKITTIFTTYRRGIAEITDVFMRNMVRDALNKASSTKVVEYVYGRGKSQLIEEVENMVRVQTKKIGIIVEKIYFIGSLRLPDQVTNALNKKIEAKQRAEQRENEIKEEEANAKKKMAVAKGDAESILMKAKAEAEANKIVGKSINQSLIDYEAVKKWNGHLPKFTGGQMTPFLDLGRVGN